MTLHDTLGTHFVGAAGKYLSAVEAHPAHSNQHEFNGVGALREFLGDPPSGGRRFATSFVFLDDDMEPRVAASSLTWYDAREAHPTRSECRLYYSSNDVTDVAVEGDYLVIARPRDSGVAGELVTIVAPRDSTVAVQLQHLFGLEPSDRFDVDAAIGNEQLSFASRLLLEALGFETTVGEDDWLGQLIDAFGDAFPTTARFSSFARASLPEVDARLDPDASILRWMEREELLYRTFERHLVGTRLASATGDVDKTLEIAMQTFQRRRARAGQALENHVAEVLRAFGIAFEQQATTEGRKRPDFLFPSQEAYKDERFPADGLTMLAVKTTCKDRWRQVLTEADAIKTKHLLTLEAPVSCAQTDEMKSRSLLLVVPASLHALFMAQQKSMLLSVSEFLSRVK